MKVDLDPWQKDILDTKGNIALRSGRQVGKSTIISIKAAEYAAKNRGKTILIIASVERQARLLFEKTLAYLVDHYKIMICKGKKRPTLHIVNLTNGSRIYCLPTGMSGYGIRGYTVDMLIADEAAFINEDVWQAVTPMLATTKGNIILLSTPFGKGGYFYRCFSNPAFKTFHISSEDCHRIDKTFLEQEKKRMSTVEYSQEYLGEFVDELMQFFPTSLIKSCMRHPVDMPKLVKRGVNHYLGADIAQLGGDETVLLTMARVRRNYLQQRDMVITENTRLTDTIETIKFLNHKWKYKKMFIDSGGLGVGVTDALLADADTRRKVIEINNSSRSVEWNTTKRKRILKEDLYTNLLRLMEKGKIFLTSDPRTLLSLSSVQCEYKDGRVKLFGKYTHIAEALIRAAWAMKDKSLNIWVR